MYVHTVILPDSNHTRVHTTLPFEAKWLLQDCRISPGSYVVILPNSRCLEYMMVLRQIVRYEAGEGRRRLFLLLHKDIESPPAVCSRKQWEDLVRFLAGKGNRLSGRRARYIKCGMFRLHHCWCKLLSVDRETGLLPEQKEVLEHWFFGE